MATRYEYYATGADGNLALADVDWKGQTFTIGTTGTNESFYISKVVLNLARKAGSTIGNVIVSIRAVDAAGLPTGSDLTAITFNGDSLSTSQQSETFYLPEYKLEAGTKYAIILRAPEGDDANNYITWRRDGSSASYSGGAEVESANSGTTWSEDTDDCFYFEVWGNSAVLNVSRSDGLTKEGPGSAGTRVIRSDYPNTRGLTAGTTKHLIDSVDYDDEA